MRFDGKVAVITAAASGIGRATADIIGREGGIVVGWTPTRAGWKRPWSRSATREGGHTR
jgi:NAD(P)-dependent dehydrogenase (short-subunit alcohol dehydrogenase family)